MEQMKILRLFLLWMCFRTSSAESVDHFFPNDLPPIPQNITVGAYYYPWHKDDFHRGDGYLRKELNPRHEPALGEYDDTRPEVIAQHLAWSRQANIKLWVCSWWGPGSREDETIRTAILPNPDLGKHQIALLYESTGRVKAAEGWSPHRVQDDMRHICQEYFDHPNYYKVDGVPVIVMYLSRLLHKADALETVVTIMRETAREVCDTEIFILGDQVWGPAPTEEYMPFELLDAVTNYDIYGNVNKAPFAGQQAVNNYYQDQREWSVQAAKRGVRYVPGVSPGYNDRAVRLYKDNIGLSRRLTPDSEPGTLFAAQLQQARYLVDSGIHNLLMVNSFNEWHEDSQIEPAIGEPTNLPVEMTSGNTYEGYGELYLNLLRTATCTENCLPIDQWRSTYLEQDPMDSPPPDDILVGAYYFAWYADDFYGNRGWLRNELQQQPQLGKYDDRDPAVIAQHLEWSRRANIGLWITSWAGPNDDRDTTLRNVIFPHEDLEDHKIALLYEVQNRVKEKENWNLERVAADIEYVCHSYLDLPNYYTSKGGKPVIFLAQTRTLYSKGVLEDVVDMIRLVAKTHGYDIFLVGDQVWSEAPRDEIYLPFFSLDAVTNYDIYGNMGTYGYAGQDKVDKYYERQREWRDKAWKSKCAFVPGVTPGFNDRGTRLHANHHALSRILTEEEGTGSFFRASLTKARYLVDSDLHNLLVVNSFNNWMEDTQIEPIQTDVPPSSIPEELTEGLTYFGYGDLYLEILSNATQDLIPKNDTDPHFNGMFYPLRCNVIASLSTMECTETWTSLYGTTVEHLKEIEIPCGSCVVLDHPEPVLKLLGGLDIQGKLVIPDGYKVSIEATHIRVQGELQIISSKVVDGTPNVRILLVNGEPGIEKFQPALSNTNACGVQRCDPGPKSIFVVGGKLDIRGLAPDTPTLANLIDVVTEAHLPPLYRPEVCPSNGKYILGRFDQDFSASIFSGTPGSHVVHGESSLLVLDRTSTQHGVQIDLQSIRECLSSEESYILSMKLRVNRKGMEQVSTECATLGQNCLQVYSDFMNQSQVLTSITKYEGPVRSKFNYGEWMTIEEHISFRTEELDLSNIYLTLRVAGGDQGADIELEHFSLQLSPQDSCSSPTPDCRDLVLCNGDAEFGMEQTPFYEKGDVLIRTEVENYGNHFWRVYREEAISVLSGIQWDIPVECMKENAVYRFKMRIRVHPHENHPDPIITSVYIRSHRAGSDTQTRVTNCPPSAGKWVSCDGYMLVTSAMLGDLDNVSVYFETVGSTDTTYDVDDLSFKFVHMDGPVTGLVVEGIKEKWTTGSEILITSHTLNWDDQVVRTISGIENYGEDGQVLIELNSPITRPPAQRGSDFPVEVALLSRNIVFEAAKEGSEESSHQGGRLTVFHTPDVQQTIEGVEFKNFGQQGVADAHPILFHYSESIPGSSISKNAIRESNQGCIVLAGTNEVLVQENIAYDTLGHCFVLRDGIETGNVLRRNLGAKTRQTTEEGPNNSRIPATFLITNPNNVIEENVGAGSQGEAFSIILRSGVMSPHGVSPMIEPAALAMTHFWNNVAHSNYVRGFHLQMTSDYRSQPTTKLLGGIRAFKNSGPGILISNSENVIIEGGHFSDNRGNIDMHRSEDVQIRNVSIVGKSKELELLEVTQPLLSAALCPNRQTVISAIGFRSFTRAGRGTGMTVQDVDISGFEDISTCKEYAFLLDPEIGWGAFDFFSQLSRVKVEKDARRFQLCDSFRSSIRDVYVIDNDSSLKPPEITWNKEWSDTSSIVSEGSLALEFIPEEKKTYVDGLCYYYCADTCLRTVIISINPAEERELSLRVCERGKLETCAFYSGNRYYEPSNPATSLSFVSTGKLYHVALPNGRYEASFFDTEGSRVWPKFVEETYGDPLCEDSLTVGSFWIPEPPVQIAECASLLQNGDAEMSGETHSHWITGPGGINVLPNQGTGNIIESSSQAFCDAVSPNGNSGGYSIGQYIDTRCFVDNQMYKVEASVRLTEKTTNLPISMECPDGKSCPTIGFFFVSKDGFSWFQELNHRSTNIFANRRHLATNDGYERVEGKLLINPEIASAASVFFYIKRNNNDENVLFCMDDISITLNTDVGDL